MKNFRAALAGQTNVAYVVAGSAMTAMMKLFQSPEAPLFLQFETLALEPFGRQDAEVLMRKLGSEYLPGVYAEVFRYTAGFPFYITALMQRLDRLQQSGEVISADSVRYAFLLETLWRGGQIYNYCRYVYDLSLQRARGYGMLKAILQFLAGEQGGATLRTTLSEIARALAAGVASRSQGRRSSVQQGSFAKKQYSVRHNCVAQETLPPIVGDGW